MIRLSALLGKNTFHQPGFPGFLPPHPDPPRLVSLQNDRFFRWFHIYHSTCAMTFMTRLIGALGVTLTIGKKNWLFMGDADAGKRSAIIHTIIESCRRRRLDPYAYLKDVLTRPPGRPTIKSPPLPPKPGPNPKRQSSFKQYHSCHSKLSLTTLNPLNFCQ